MPEPAISVRQVSKAYRMWDSPAARLTVPMMESAALFLPGGDALRRRAAARYRDFWALRDVSFTVEPGEAVGIIGRNGSGKSTLLQIIAGTLRPSAGEARVRGRVAALLELGSGFNPEFTGRENVQLSASVLGLTRAEIDRRFPAIADFADIGDFIDQPVKTYSSGMTMRLAFAVHTSIDPEILIVDEALAVGDAQFVAKCINRISDFIRGGGTLLFVSHEVGVVKQLTSRALYLDHGRQVAFGPTPETTLAYTNALALPAAAGADPERFVQPDSPYLIEDARLTAPGTAAPLAAVGAGEAARLVVDLAVRRPAPARLVFSVYNYMSLIVCREEVDLPAPPDGRAALRVEFLLPRLRLAPGNYRVNFAVRNGIEIVAWARNAVHFTVAGTTTETFIYQEDTTVSFSFPATP